VSKIKKIAWITSTLHTVGGGERLLMEGVKYYRSQGIEVIVITWDFGKEALFDGLYSGEGIVEIAGSRDPDGPLMRRALRRLRTVGTLRRMLKKFDPDVILNQSEYDATLLKMALVGTRYPHVSLVFGQMFQFRRDLAKYAWPFNRHLDEIRLSTPGYREFVPAKRPKSSFKDRVLAQMIAIPRWFALRASKVIIVFSKQVQWEVSKIYGAKSIIAKGAYPRDLIGQTFAYDQTNLRKREGDRILLSLSRLVEKKRVALKIQALGILVHERGIKDLRLVVGGKGDEADRLAALVKQLNLEEHVTFLGYVPEAEVYPLTQICDVYLSLDVADFDITPYVALALKRKIIWSSEMDSDDYLLSCGAIFPAEPLPADVADAIVAALKKDDASIDWSGLDHYTWETYFETIRRQMEAVS
jgi:glycosyltransferase involved in cell wall biosynthesis